MGLASWIGVSTCVQDLALLLKSEVGCGTLQLLQGTVCIERIHRVLRDLRIMELVLVA